MTEKLKDYQVLDVFCSGTLYKVRHKITSSICAWKPYNCSAFSDEQIQNIVNEVKTLSKVLSENFLRYYDTILHGPTKTLYFVLEYISWQSLQELISLCKATHKHFTEHFIWYTLLELARTCKAVEGLNLLTLKKNLTPETIFVGPKGELRVNYFQLCPEDSKNTDLIYQVGELIRTICYLPCVCDERIEQFRYSDDLRDVIDFLTVATNLRSDVILYHPTVLAHTGAFVEPIHCTNILIASEDTTLTLGANKCDSEKAVEQCKSICPIPRIHTVNKSPIYYNLSPKQKLKECVEGSQTSWESMSPTVAALALELPGYIPRSRKPYSKQFESYNDPQEVSEDTLSKQWMSRLIALREREESLNRRERSLIAKEIIHSPTEAVDQNITVESTNVEKNGITLPQVINKAIKENGTHWVSRRRQRRSNSVRTKARRKSYEDLDSSLSADTGDSSMIITAAKITKENMPCRSLFSQVSTKNAHFTASNPFTESDESVTLTFYELENLNSAKSQLTNQQSQLKEISNFKYLDMEKMSSEKRVATQWNHSSPQKQAKMTGKVFSDITNKSSRQAPTGTTSLLSTSSSVTKTSSSQGQLGNNSKTGVNEISEQTSNEKLCHSHGSRGTIDISKSKRKSLLPFKTPFKFKTSTKTSLV